MARSKPRRRSKRRKSSTRRRRSNRYTKNFRNRNYGSPKSTGDLGLATGTAEMAPLPIPGTARRDYNLLTPRSGSVIAQRDFLRQKEKKMLDDSPSATPRITPRLTTARVAPCAAPCSMFEKGNNIVDTFTDEGLKILETQDNMSSNRLLELSVHPPKKARLLELIEHEFEHAQYKFRKDGKRVFHVAGV